MDRRARHWAGRVAPPDREPLGVPRAGLAVVLLRPRAGLEMAHRCRCRAADRLNSALPSHVRGRRLRDVPLNAGHDAKTMQADVEMEMDRMKFVMMLTMLSVALGATVAIATPGDRDDRRHKSAPNDGSRHARLHANDAGRPKHPQAERAMAAAQGRGFSRKGARMTSMGNGAVTKSSGRRQVAA